MTSPSKETVRVEPHARIALHAGKYEDGRFTVSFTWPYATPPSISLQQNFVICGNNAHDEMVKALESAPRPKPSTDPVEYMDWYFKVRTALLSRLKSEG